MHHVDVWDWNNRVRLERESANSILYTCTKKDIHRSRYKEGRDKAVTDNELAMLTHTYYK